MIVRKLRIYERNVLCQESNFTWSAREGILKEAMFEEDLKGVQASKDKAGKWNECCSKTSVYS